MDKKGHGDQKTSPGGVGLGFHTSLCVRVAKTGEFKTAGGEGAKLSWKIFYSSLGLDKRSIDVPYIETFDDQNRQVCYFDWDVALIDLLKDLTRDGHYQKLNELLGTFVEYSAGNKGKVYSCGLLGIKGEEAAKDGDWTARKLGETLQKDPAIRTQLQDVMRIQRWPVWTPGIDLEIPLSPKRKAAGGGKPSGDSGDA
jgi:hypothetical protein